MGNIVSEPLKIHDFEARFPKLISRVVFHVVPVVTGTPKFIETTRPDVNRFIQTLFFAWILEIFLIFP